jgi:hypothetical protein
MPLRTVHAARYVQPLREGGSMPALVEADDGKMYVVKLRGAGQGVLALVAELISGEIARALGLHVPELVLVQIDPQFGRAERDPEIRDLLRKSTGLNAGLAFLAGSTTFDSAAGDGVDAVTASRVVWLDAFTLNVDRTSRNANLLLWRALLSEPEDLWLIDHGASLYFHHNWPSAEQKAVAAFEQISDHILLRWATEIPAASAHARKVVTPDILSEIVAQIPDDWLDEEAAGVTAAERRAEYLKFFNQRLQHARIFEEEVERARTNSV